VETTKSICILGCRNPFGRRFAWTTSILNARDADFALEIGACKIINIKVGRVGGFSEAKKFTM